MLVSASHLVNDLSIRPVPCSQVTYCHLLIDGHELVKACGVFSESFHPNAFSLRGLGAEARHELLALFPELAARDSGRFQTARRTLRRFEVGLMDRFG